MTRTRNDIKCLECGRMRHRDCKTCGQPTGDHHSHSEGFNDNSSPQQPVRVEDRPEPSQSLIAMESMDDLDAYDSAIPDKSILDKYIPRKIGDKTDLEIMVAAYRHTVAHPDEGLNVRLIGDAGTGKDHLSYALGAHEKIPVWSIALNGGSTVEDIIGQPLFVNGSTVWADGIVTYAARHGGIIIFDEINACPNEIAFVLHPLLDWRRELTLVQKGREVIKAHPNFFAIGTMNPDYRGTKPLNEAFADRFHLVMEIDYDNKVEKRLIQDEKLLTVASKLRKMYTASELETPCSTRMLLDYRRNTKLFGQATARNSFVARYTRADQTAVAEAFDLEMNTANIGNLEFEQDA